MLKLGVVVVAVLVLSGCASEVDKCVDAGMAGHGIKKDRENPIASQIEQTHMLKCMGVNEDIGRYQIVPNTMTVAVTRVDTKTGEVSYCYPDSGKQKVVCITQ